MQDDELLKAVDAAGDWLKIDGVVAVAPGERYGRGAIVVGVSRPVSTMVRLLPATFRGYAVVLEDWGNISAQRGE